MFVSVLVTVVVVPVEVVVGLKQIDVRSDVTSMNSCLPLVLPPTNSFNEQTVFVVVLLLLVVNDCPQVAMDPDPPGVPSTLAKTS